MSDILDATAFTAIAFVEEQRHQCTCLPQMIAHAQDLRQVYMCDAGS